jgi:anti-anti-sigma factor
MNLGITTVECTDPAVVSLAGELDIGSAPELAERARVLVTAGHVRLVLDLTDLTFCDSTGLAAFVRAKNDCQRSGGYLRLAAPTPNVARILAVVGLLDTFPTYQTVDAARRSDAGGLVVAGG